MTADTSPAHDAMTLTGIGVQELIEPTEHDCLETDEGVHEWVTPASVERYGYDESQLDDDEAFCLHCGAESTVVDREQDKNVVVDVGAEKIADYIAGNSVANDFVNMRIGSTATPSAPAEGDTTLSNTVDSQTGITPAVQTTGGASKVVVWSTTFPSGGTSKTSVNSQGMFDGTGTAAEMLNRLTFTSKDNANNDLKLTYELTVS